jgi:hypothetical protein
MLALVRLQAADEASHHRAVVVLDHVISSDAESREHRLLRAETSVQEREMECRRREVTASAAVLC